MSFTVKEMFEGAENGTLTYEQFEAVMKEKGAKFADLSDGKYVSKSKYDADLKAKDTAIETADAQIKTLNETIATRDTDLGNLQKKLEEVGQDANKLAEAQEQLSGLQQKYEADVKNYESKMQQQAYEFAVKDFASTKNFTSQAAKRDFIQSMIARGLQMEGDKILGREDFVEKYASENADAFVVEKTEPETAPTPTTESAPEPALAPVPQFVAPTPGPEPGATDTGFHFDFTGVRAH